MRSRGLVVVVALAMVVLLTPGRADAAPGAWAAAFDGSGTISPGLTLAPEYDQTISLWAMLIGGAVSGPGAAAGVFLFSGMSRETVVSGQGFLSGSCIGARYGSAAMSCVDTYNCVGALVISTFECSGSATSALGGGSTASAIWMGVSVWAPTSAPGPPITAYDLIGALGGAGVI